MADQTAINQVCTHLRLMGYDVSVADDKIKTIGAQHSERLPIRVRVINAGIFLSTYCRGNDSAMRDHIGYLEFVNSVK